ncbi:MAG: hypothetical protein WBX38_07565 [Candidatus Sulfotelmatobacter sp.]
MDYVELFESYEKLLGYRKRLCMPDDSIAIDLCEFYAVWGAYKVFECTRVFVEPAYDNISDHNVIAIAPDERLRRYEAIARRLLAGSELNDVDAIAEALNEMGSLALFPFLEQIFPRLEEISSRVNGLAQQVFWVDLSLFAAKVGDFRRAGEYVRQARRFSLSSRELYNTCIIEGLIALSHGSVADAVQCLGNATVACEADVESSIQCCLLSPNFELAERLLEFDKRIGVLEHLLACHNVWQGRRAQIEAWIHMIETGEKPLALVGGDREKLSERLPRQWMRACSFALPRDPAKSSIAMSPAQVLAERDKRTAKHVEGFRKWKELQE